MNVRSLDLGPPHRGRAREKVHRPGEPASTTGHFDEVNVFGTPTGRTVRARRGASTQRTTRLLVGVWRRLKEETKSESGRARGWSAHRRVSKRMPHKWRLRVTCGASGKGRSSEQACLRFLVTDSQRVAKPRKAVVGDGVDAPRRHLRAMVEVLTIYLKEASVGQATTIGLDIAKHVFQAHGADEAGNVLFRKRLTRAKLLEFFARQPAASSR
jgi:hypothetical protein